MADEALARGHGGQTPPYEQRYRWVMLVLVWLLYVLFGLVSFSLPALVTPVIADLKISYSQMGFILGAWPLTYIVVAATGGAVIDRWGLRRAVFAGVVLIGLSALLRYFAGGFGTMFLFVALFGLGGPMVSIGCPKAISLWFRGKGRGTAVGIYLTGPWIGSALSLSLMNSVIMPLVGYNWRLAYAGLGVVVFAAALLWLVLSREVAAEDTAGRVGINRVFRGLVSVRNVQLVLVLGFLSFGIGHGFSDWLPKILETGGLPLSIAGVAASVPSWASIPAILIIPRLVAPAARGRVIALAAAVVVGAILVVMLTGGASLVAALVIYGLSYSCILPLLVLILMDLPEVGSKYMGSAAGMFFCVAELGGFAGPLLLGAIKDFSGSFLAGAYLLAGLSLLRVILALGIRLKPEK